MADFYNTIDSSYRNAVMNNVVFPCFKVELLDWDENILGEITQDVSPESSGSININFQQGVRRSCSVTLINIAGKYNFNAGSSLWINTKFKLYIGMRAVKGVLGTSVAELLASDSVTLDYSDSDFLTFTDDTGNVRKFSYDTYWFSQGIYILTNPSESRDMSKGTVTLTGTDKFSVFGSDLSMLSTDGTYLIPYMTPLENAIRAITQVNMGNGHKFDPKPPIVSPDLRNELLPYEISLSEQQYFSEALIEIANAFACDIYYDVEGNLRVEKGNLSRQAETYTSVWDFSDVLPDYATPTIDYDFSNVYNIIKVVGNNPACNVYTSTVENRDYSSPTNIALIGRKNKYVESTFCYNQERTDDYAAYLAKKYSIVQSTIKFQATIIPSLDVNQVVTITDKIYQYTQQRFIIQSITFPLSTKTQMSIEAANCATLPFFAEQEA